jgi:DNA integrity scanning protein DisA with diadenylate cyclase activity
MDYQNEFFNNLIEISNFKKGTIIVLGDELNKNNYNKCIKGSINLVYKGKYRSNILTQLSLTDGAVLINNKLNIYGFGVILKINGKADITNLTGGSRTYIAQEFAKENKNLVVIKISEDGPISVYYEGECKIAI